MMNYATTKEAVEALAAAGEHIIPIKGDGSKMPSLATWKQYQTVPPTKAELDEWFDNHHDRGLALVGGRGLDPLDIDRADLFDPWSEIVEEQAPGLLALLPIVKTPRPGYHVHYKCKTAEPKQVLAKDVTSTFAENEQMSN